MVVFTFFHLQFLLLLFGLSAVITEKVNIKCHAGFTIDGHHVPDPHFSNGDVDCTAEYDRCGFLTFALSPHREVRLMKCTRSFAECNNNICGLVTAHAMAEGLGIVTECVQTCCDSDMCNAPGKGEDKIRDLTGNEINTAIKA